jgi:WD40 repeat protein
MGTTNTDPAQAKQRTGGDQSPKPLLTLVGPDKEVNWMAFSPDGARLATASGGQAILWDAATGRKLRTLGSESAPLYGPLQFFPGGRCLAGVGPENTADVWDTDTGRLLRRLPVLASAGFEAVLSPTGRHFASWGDLGGGQGGLVVLHDARTGKALATLRTKAVTSLAFTADDRRLVTGGLDGQVALWELASRSVALTLEPPGELTKPVRVMLSPDSRRVVALWYGEGVGKRWTLPDGQGSGFWLGGQGRIWEVTQSPDGEKLLATIERPRQPNRPPTHEVWLRNKYGSQVIFTHHVLDYRRGKAPYRFAFSPCGTHLATAYSDGTVRIWSVRQLLGEHGDDCAGGCGPLGRPRLPSTWRLSMKTGLLFGLLPLLLTGGTDPGPPARAPLLTLRHADAVTRVRFSPDGRQLATASADKTAAVWDAATGQRRHTLKGHREVLLGLSFNPDGSRLATGAADGTVRIWDTGTGRPVRTSAEHFRLISDVAFSPRGNYLATAEVHDDPAGPPPPEGVNRVQVRDARTGKRRAVFPNSQQRFTCVSFSPDERWLAAGDSGGCVTVWDVVRGETVRTLRGHKGWVTSVSFRPDGRRLAAGGGDGVATVWEIVTGQKSLSLPGPGGQFLRLVWSRDGRWLGSVHWPEIVVLRRGPERAEVRMWDTASGQGHLILGLKDLGGRAYDLAFSPDGTRIATAHTDGTVKVWSVQQLLGQRGER